MNSYLLILIVIGLSIMCGIFIYVIGGHVAPHEPQTEITLAPYACGEDFPAEKSLQNTEEFFIYIAYFLIFDIAGFLLALSLGNPGVYVAAFIGILLVSSVSLYQIKGAK